LENPENMMTLKEGWSIKVGVPIMPMLSKSIKTYLEIEERFDQVPFTAEYKYDGMRG
jgi:DNA ligase-1